MQIHKLAKIERCVSTDETRHVLTQPYLDIQDGEGRMIATDGKCMAVVPVDVDANDVAGHVPAESLKTARKVWGKLTLNTLAVGESAVSVGDYQWKRPLDMGKFPNWRNVIPSPEKDRTEILRVGINPEFLSRVAEAIGAGDLVNLEIPIETQGRYKGQVLGAIVVRPRENCAVAGAFGLVMPARID
jgi:hypothetical protein